MRRRSARLKKQESGARTVMVFNNPKLREILHAELCGFEAELKWAGEEDFEPGTPGLVLQLLNDEAIHKEIRDALASHGWVWNGLPQEGVPWAWRYPPETHCPPHKDMSPEDQWSLVIGVQTQGELVHIEFAPGIVQSHSLVDGDMLLFKGARFRHWTDKVGSVVHVWLSRGTLHCQTTALGSLVAMYPSRYPSSLLLILQQQHHHHQHQQHPLYFGHPYLTHILFGGH